MTIPEAIKDLTDMKKVLRSFLPAHEQEALDLAIEALKERQEAINQGLPLWHELLPGETKD